MKAVHYVPLRSLLLDPDALRTACGGAQRGLDWSTNPAAVSCPGCIASATASGRGEARHGAAADDVTR